MRSLGAAASQHLFLELPGEFLLSGLCCCAPLSGSTEGQSEIDCSEHRRLMLCTSMWVACRAIYLCPLGLSETTSVWRALGEGEPPQRPFQAPQQPLVSGWARYQSAFHISVSVCSIVPLRTGKICMFTNILWSVMQ